MNRVFRALGVLALAPLGLAGCGTAEGTVTTNMVPVKGTITYKGKPLTQGTIVFEPEDAGREAHGEIGPDGSFMMSTFQEGDGVMPGMHRVAITPLGKTRIPARYRNTSASRVRVEVSASKQTYLVELD